MNEQIVPITRALISVSDKTGLEAAAKRLVAAGVSLISTGGTAAATCRLVEELRGVVVGLGFLIEIGGLGGRARLGERTVESLHTY